MRDSFRAVTFAQVLGSYFAGGQIAIADGDARALSRRRAGNAEPEATTAAGDHEYLILDSKLHAKPSYIAAKMP
jgi:hypothetical protein